MGEKSETQTFQFETLWLGLKTMPTKTGQNRGSYKPAAVQALAR